MSASAAASVKSVGLTKSNPPATSIARVTRRSAVALTVDGKDFTATEVDYFYHATLNSVASSTYSSYMGIDTSKSMKDQTMNAMAKMLLQIDAEEDITWDQYLKDTAKSNLTRIYLMSEKAKAEGMTFDDHMQEEMQSSRDLVNSSS